MFLISNRLYTIRKSVTYKKQNTKEKENDYNIFIFRKSRK